MLELGGNDPLIVMEDVDPHWAAALAVAGAYKNSGQRCTAVKRVLVIDTVTDAFVETVVARTKTLTCGDPMDPNSDIWTVVDSAAAMLFASRVNDAILAGVTLLCGHVRDGALYPSTVVDHVPADCELVHKETFGPVCPIICCCDIDHLIEVSNGTAYGLSSGVCTDRLDHIAGW